MGERCCRVVVERAVRNSLYRMRANSMPVAHLRTTREFQALYRRGIAVRTPHLRLLWRRSPTPSHRWGVVVSVKISKLATRRNRIRRILFAEINQWTNNHPTPILEAMVVVTKVVPNESVLRAELMDCFLQLSHRLTPPRPQFTSR